MMRGTLDKNANLFSKLKEVSERLQKLESVTQNIGADIVGVSSSALNSEDFVVEGNSEKIITRNVSSTDNVLYLIRLLWSLEVIDKGNTKLAINYEANNIFESKTVDTLVAGEASFCYPINHSSVETSTGIIAVFWIDDPTAPSLYMSTSTDQGETWSEGQLVASLNPNYVGSMYRYDVAIDDNDNIHVVYNRLVSSDMYIYYKLLTYNAGSWTIGSEETLDNGISIWPSICYSATLNKLFAGWTKYTGSSEYQYKSKYKDSPSGSWTGESFPGPTNGQKGLKTGRIVEYAGSVKAIWYFGYNSHVYTCDWNSSTQNWGSVVDSFWTSATVIHNFSIVTLDNNEIHCLIQNTNDSSFLIEWRYFNGVGWTSSTNISEGSKDGMPALTKNGNTAIAFWSKSNLVDTAESLIRKKITNLGASLADIVDSGSPTPSRDTVSTPVNIVSENFSFATFAREQSPGSGVDQVRFARQYDSHADDIEFDVLTNEDDGFEEDNTTWDDSESKCGEDPAGTNSWDLGVRFQNITIPQGATINTAYLKFYGNENSSGKIIDVIVKGIKETNANAFSSSSRPSQRSKTTEVVNWSIADRLINVQQTSPDITNIVQEIVSQASWVSGNAMAFVLEDNGNSDESATFVDLDQASSDSWYNVINNKISFNWFCDWATSDDANGIRIYYFIINNLTANQITIRLRSKAYALTQDI